MVAAKTRGTTKNLIGFVDDTSIASICSLTFILPNSAPMLDAIFPAHISAIITGPISRITEIATMLGTKLSAPKAFIVGSDCSVSTNPRMNPVMPTSERDLTPIMYAWRKNSFHSKPLRKMLRKKVPIKATWSPAALNCLVQNAGVDVIIY